MALIKAGRQEGRKAIPIDIITKQRIINDIENYNIGYLVIKNKYGYSQDKLNKNGIFTYNKSPLVKAEHELMEEKSNRVDFNQIDQPLVVDQSDTTDKSLTKANKKQRVIKFGNIQIKLAVATNGNNSVLVINEQSTSGELKTIWEKVLMKATTKQINFKTVVLDSQAKLDYHKDIVRVNKNSKHPYNSIVEGKFSQLKGLLYRSPDIKQLTKEQLIERINNLWEFVESQEKAKTKKKEKEQLRNKPKQINQSLLKQIQQITV